MNLIPSFGYIISIFHSVLPLPTNMIMERTSLTSTMARNWIRCTD
ncbi:hypothetical protein MK137Hg11_000291900 [Dysgonomonas reticulitermitis]